MTRSRAALAALYLLALLFRAPDLAAPWIHNHDDEGALLSHFAANHNRLGLAETRGANDLRAGPRARDLPRVSYLHHPPLFPLLLAPAQAALDDSEGTTRLATILLTSTLAPLSAILLPGPAGLVAGVLWAVLPGPAFFGRTATFHVLSVPLLAALLAALRADRTRTAGALAFLLPWGYLPNLLLLPPLLLSDRAAARRVLLPAALGLAAVLAHLFALQGTDGILHLAAAGARRSDAANGWMKFLGLVGGYLPWTYLILHTVLLACVGVFSATRVPREEGLDPAATLLLAGALHVFLFPQAAVLHDYWSYGFWYGLVLFAGRGAAWLGADGPLARIRKPLAGAMVVLAVLGSLPARLRFEVQEPYETSREAARLAWILPLDAVLESGDLSPHHLLYYSGRALAPPSLANFTPVPRAYRDALAPRPRYGWSDTSGWTR